MSDSKCVPDTITIDGVEFVRKDTVAQRPNGNRAVMVMDRGWVMAGDVEYKNGRVFLTRVIHVRRWESVGFDGMVKDPNNKNVKPHLFPLPDCDFPATTELFKIPVPNNWGF